MSDETPVKAKKPRTPRQPKAAAPESEPMLTERWEIDVPFPAGGGGTVPYSKIHFSLLLHPDTDADSRKATKLKWLFEHADIIAEFYDGVWAQHADQADLLEGVQPALARELIRRHVDQLLGIARPEPPAANGHSDIPDFGEGA